MNTLFLVLCAAVIAAVLSPWVVVGLVALDLTARAGGYIAKRRMGLL